MAEKRALVSVIVVTYNDRQHLDECLSGLLSQHHEALEIIVVDNCSSDGTLAYVEQRFRGVVTLACDSNVGYMGGVSWGLKRAKGEYVAVLNPDTRPDSDWLHHLVTALEEHSRAGATTSKILIYGDGNRINAMGLNIHVSGLGFCRGLNQLDRPSYEADRSAPVAGVSGCAFLIRRSLLQQVIDIVEDDFMYHEDVELSWLIRLLGYEIYYVPNSVVHHKYNVAMDASKFYLLERNRVRWLLYALSPGAFLACLPLLALTELLVLGYAFLKGPAYVRNKVGTWVFLVAHMRSLLRKRRRVQSLRRVSDWHILRKFQFGYQWDQLFQIARRTRRLSGRGIR